MFKGKNDFFKWWKETRMFQEGNKTGSKFTGVISPENEKDHYAIKHAEFVVPLVKAVQEQQELIDELMKRIEVLENK